MDGQKVDSPIRSCLISSRLEKAMNGLRIVARPDHLARRPLRRTIPFAFGELAEPILPDIQDFYCGLYGAMFYAGDDEASFPDDDELESYFELVAGTPLPPDNEEVIWDVGWLQPGRLSVLARFIKEDWTDIVLVTSPPAYRRSEVWFGDKEWLENHAEVFFSCIDAAYWEVFARSQSVLDKIHGAFPESRPMTLEQKRY